MAALAAALVVALSSGGGPRPGAHLPGSAATGPTVVQLAAHYLHLSPAEVRRRLGSGETLAEIAAAAGRSRHDLVEAIYARKAAQIKALHLPAARERAELEATRSALAERVSRRHRVSSLIAAAAGYLGLTVGQLDAKVRSGHTLASLAEAAKGRSRAGLLATMTKGRRAAIEEASLQGRASSAAAKRRVARLLRRAERLIERTGG
jgi:hypothetical protein